MIVRLLLAWIILSVLVGSVVFLMEGRGRHFDPALVYTFSGIADLLYREINGDGDKLLESTLDELIDRYFPGLSE